MVEIDLSVVIPCYKEEPHLRESTRVLTRVLEQTRYEYEVIFVDDCSPDGTRGVIEELCREYERARYIFHESNKGRGAAFKTGFAAATGRFVGFLDIDLEVGAHYVPNLVRHLEHEGFDVATGNRYYLLSQTGAWTRHFLSHAYRLLCRFLLGFDVRDSETGCKFFLKSTTSEVVLSSENDRWFWDTEVMVRAALANLKIIELPVLFLRRHDKESTVSIVRDSWEYLVDLYRFRKNVGLGMIDRSPIYWTGVGYNLFMWLLCGEQNRKNLARVSGLIARGSSISDLCCGTASLYRGHFKSGECRYLGLDANGHFIMYLRRRGIPAKLHDVNTDSIEPADYVVMCNSFYHFYDDARQLLDRMRRAASKAVIISEPVKNLSASSFAPLAWLANRLTNPGVGDFTKRFDLDSFRRFAEENGASDFIFEDGDHNAIAVFRNG